MLLMIQQAPMVNPGVFREKQLDFLNSCREDYTRAVAEDRASEYVLDAQRRFFLRFDPEKGQHHQPSDDELAAVDDNEPAKEIHPPDEESMSEEEYKEKRREWFALQAWLRWRKDVSAMNEPRCAHLTSYAIANQAMASVPS
jgi:hypothetical protein